MGSAMAAMERHSSPNGYRKSCWYEEEIEENLRWSFALNSILHTGMCDIDEEVVDFCKEYLDVNREAFNDARLEIVINDADSLICCRTELESGKQVRCDVIIGDLPDPIEGGPCYKLYTKSFYEFTVKPKLNHGGIFATDAPFDLSVDELDQRIQQRMKGENKYFDGKTFSSDSTLSKAIRKSLDNETHVYTEGTARFIYGHGKHD